MANAATIERNQAGRMRSARDHPEHSGNLSASPISRITSWAPWSLSGCWRGDFQATPASHIPSSRRRGYHSSNAHIADQPTGRGWHPDEKPERSGTRKTEQGRTNCWAESSPREALLTGHSKRAQPCDRRSPAWARAGRVRHASVTMA